MPELKIVKRFLLCLLIVLVMAVPSLAQVPNCQINFGPWTDVNASAASFNGVTQCAYWVITYQVTGFSAISLAFESATGTQAGPGAFANFTGTVATGVNPNTSVSCATPTNCTSTFTGTPGWFRVNFPSHTGSGRIQGTLQGYKTGYLLGGNQASATGCPGTVATPCVVDGVTAAGSPPATAPVMVAGSDGVNVRTIKTDVNGVTLVSINTSGVDGLGNSALGSLNTAFGGFPIQTAGSGFNGVTWDRGRTASLANFPPAITSTARNSIGVSIAEKGSRFIAMSSPAVGAIASATVAAEVGVRHVLDCIGFSASSFGAITATDASFNIRDGASGVGTLLWTYALDFPVATGAGVQIVPVTHICGLNLVGSTNTAMTVEFSVGATNLAQSINFTAYNVN